MPDPTPAPRAPVRRKRKPQPTAAPAPEAPALTDAAPEPVAPVAEAAPEPARAREPSFHDRFPRAAPTTRNAPRPRQRGLGPDCPKCGSVMWKNGHVPGNHPFRRMHYWKCQNPECGHTLKA